MSEKPDNFEDVIMHLTYLARTGIGFRSSRSASLSLVVILVTMLLTAIGCSSGPKSGSYGTARTWKCGYPETWIINTEPSGARVYLGGASGDQYIGESPVTINVNGGPIVVFQGGIKRWSGVGAAQQEWEDWSGGVHVDQMNQGMYTLKAYKDGLGEAEVKVVYSPGNELLARSVELAGEPDAQGMFRKELPQMTRHMLLRLTPTGSAQLASGYLPPDGRSTNQQQLVAEAQGEYEGALAEYNRAVEKYQAAKSKRSLAAMTAPSSAASGQGWVRVAGALNTIGSQAEVNQTEGELEVARQKLERAKDRLNNLGR